jgi:hypothetical protein
MRAASNRGNGFSTRGEEGDANGSWRVRKSSAEAVVVLVARCWDRTGTALMGRGAFTKAQEGPGDPKGIRPERRGIG